MKVSIHPIKMGIDTIYAIRGEGVILIDGGDPGKLKKFKKGIDQASIAPQDIKLICVTHGHWDHVGSIKDIKELTGAKVLMHQKDMHFLQDAHPVQPPGITPWGKVITALVRLYLSFVRNPTFEVDLIAEDDTEISLAEYGIPGTVIHTPGHTWGSVSVLLETGDAFVGDLAMNALPMRSSPGLPVFGDDLQVIKESWQKLLDRGATTIYPSHGEPFSADVMRKAVSS
jgi:glyoxylase-like metal-dependent hydrolase (beta-lactamase superfamily II)